MTETPEFGVPSGDDLIDDTEDNSPETVLKEMRNELSADPTVKEVSLKVEARPGYEVIYRPELEYDLLKQFSRKSRKGKGAKATFDDLQFAYQILAKTCVGLKRRGVRVTDENGEQLVFAHSDLREMLGAYDTRDCILKMYGKQEGHIISTSQEVLDRAGYGAYSPEEGEDEDGGPLGD